MNRFSKIVLAVAATALLAASFYAAKVSARRGSTHLKPQNTSMITPAEKPANFEQTVRNGEVVGMAAISASGSRTVLKARSQPVCATSCPAGQKLSCWEDEVQQMSICVCGTGGKKHLTIKKYLDKT